MNIKEAKEQLISLKENAKANIDTDEIFRLDYEALTIILNELDKKDKVIDIMAEQLAGLTIFDNSIDSPLMLGDKEEVKEYFYNKVKNDKNQ